MNAKVQESSIQVDARSITICKIELESICHPLSSSITVIFPNRFDNSAFGNCYTLNITI